MTLPDYELQATAIVHGGDAVEAYRKVAIGNVPEDDSFVLRGLLADLMHWAKHHGIDFDRELNSARDWKQKEEEGDDDESRAA